MDGLCVADRLELLGAKDRAQDRWMDTGRHFNEGPDVIDGYLATLLADQHGQSPAALQKLMVLLLKDVELALAHGTASGEISFVVNTPHGRGSRQDGEAIRKAANANGVSSVTTVEAALAAVNGLWEQRSSEVEVRSLQEYHGRA
jgi:hypothetical protein